MNIAIIPARKGSKRIKGKNVIDFFGKPLILHTVSAAIESEKFDKIIISTDCEDIAKLCENYRVEIPFKRPAYLSSDWAKSEDVIKHAISEVELKYGVSVDTVTLLQPTSPLRTKSNIREAIDLFIESKAVKLASVCELECPIEWCGKIDDSNIFHRYRQYDLKSQNFKKSYRLNGAIYIYKSKIFKTENMIEANEIVYVMRKENSVNIDTNDDLEMAKYYYKRIKKL